MVRREILRRAKWLPHRNTAFPWDFRRFWSLRKIFGEKSDFLLTETERWV